MSLNEENKPTYGTVPVGSGTTKGSRRGVVVGLVRPRARKSIHGAFMSTESSHRARRHRRDVCSSQAAAACFALGFCVASVGTSTQGLRGKTPHTETNGIFGPSGSPFGAGGFDGGMGQGFPFTGGESIGLGGPAVNTGAGMPGAGGEDVGFGVPHSHKTTPGGGVAAQGY